MLDRRESWSLGSGEVGSDGPASTAAGERALRQEQPIMSIWTNRPEPWRLGLFFAAYVLGCGFAQSLAIIPGSGISIWPNSGLFIATLLVSRMQTWPWWILAGCVAELVGDVLWFKSGLLPALLIYSGNALEALAGAWLLNRALGRPVRLNTLRQVLAFVLLGAGVAPVVSATVGATTIASFGLLSQSFAGAWQLLWIGDAAGVLIVAPLALAVLTQWRGEARLSAARWIEAGAIGLVFVAAAILSLGGNLPFAYIIMPPLLWAAVRFEFKGAAVALAVLALVTAMFTLTGDSQFAGDAETQRQRHIMLQLFLAVSAFSAVIVAAISRQHQQALRTLRESDRQLRELIGVVPVAIARMEPDGEPSFFNKRLIEFLGFDVPTLDAPGMSRLAAGMAASLHSDDAARVKDALDQSLRTGDPLTIRYRMRRADGVFRWVEQRSEPYRDDHGTILHWYGVTYDIDDQVHLTSAIEEREAKIRRLVDSDVIGIVLWDMDGSVIDANDAFLRMVQYERTDVEAGLRWFDLTPPEWQEVHAREEAAELAATGVMQPREKEYFRKDGSRVPVLIGAAAFEGQSNQGVAYILDLTERKRAEAALRSSERELSQLVDMVPSYLWRMHPDGRPAFFNRRLVEFLGFDLADRDKPGIGQLSDLIEAAIHPDDASAVAQAFAHSFESGEPLSMKWRMRRADGAFRSMAASADALRDENGRIVQWYGLCHDIDDQVRTEERLRESEFELSQLIEMAPVHISRLAPNGEPTYYSKRTMAALGIEDIGDWDQPGETRLSAMMNTSLHPDDAKRMAETIKHAIANGISWTIRYRRRTHAGGYEWREGRADPLRDENGAIRQWNCATIDIDAQMRAEIALREQERELSQLVDLVPSHLWRMGPDGSPAFFNRRFVEFLGFDAAGTDRPVELSNLIESSIHPDDAAAAAEAFADCLASGNPLSMKWRMRRADGVYRWMAASAEALRNQDGTIVQWYGLCHDIDDQVRSEEALREREQELSLLVEMVPVYVSRLTPEGEPTYYSKRTLAAMEIEDLGDMDQPGMTRLAAHQNAMLHPDDAVTMANTIKNALATGQSYVMRYRRKARDGGYEWREGRADPLRDESGAIVQWYCVSIDVDAQVRAEIALRESEQKLREIIDAVPVRIWSTASGGGPAYFNRRYQDDFLATVSKFEDVRDPRIEDLLQEAVHPEDVSHAQQTLARCFETGEGTVMRFRWREAVGQYRWAECRVEPRHDESGAIVQWYGASVDIDDEVRAQEALLLAQERVARASQAASLAELSASIAHEVNQPLAAVVANSHACQRWLTREPPNIGRAQATVERIIRDANAAGDVVSRIRALFRQSVDARSNATLEHVITEARRWVADVNSAVAIEVWMEPDLPTIPFDPVQIQQVLINLLRNGVEAVEGAPAPKAVRVSVHRAGGELQVEVSDTGTGSFDPEKVFDAFFTTKENGMGMGLAISRSIVESHGGRMWARKDGQRGATFAFTLPVAEPVAA